MNTSPATLHDPASGQRLAQITLVGSPFQAEPLLSENRELQGFAIHAGREHLRQPWLNQQILQLREGQTRQQIKIITFPTNGENQGHLALMDEEKESSSPK